MAIVKQYHKDTNTTYVYESESYWDAEKGQSRSRRRVIGKIDPETERKAGRPDQEVRQAPSAEPSDAGGFSGRRMTVTSGRGGLTDGCRAAVVP